MSFSQMAHNNQAFGEPILILQSEGDSVDIQHDLNGTIKTLSMGTDDKASYLSSQSASESYMKQIDTLYKMIYEQSFSVIPPELKSGDLPAAALKILYSPAYEKAMIDAAEYQDVLRDMVELLHMVMVVETENTIAFGNLNMRYYIEPYVHINNSASWPTSHRPYKMVSCPCRLQPKNSKPSIPPMPSTNVYSKKTRRIVKPLWLTR